MSSHTITSLFIDRVKTVPDKPALLERQGDAWVSESFREWDIRSRAIAAALISDGVASQDSISIFSYSRREWLEADMAILMAGGRTATIYQNLGGETVEHIIKDANTAIVFAEGPVQLRSIFGADGTKPLPPCLKKIIYFQNRQVPATRPGKPAPPAISLSEAVPADKKDMVVAYEDYIAQGKNQLATNFKELEQRIGAVSPNHIAKIIYTSGTTGKPKGAMLSHKNLCAVTEDLHRTLEIKPTDTTLLFLPLAHVYAQLVYHAQMRLGFSIGFARSMLTAVDDAESLKPDFFVSVPRLFEKIHSTVLNKVEQGSFIKQNIFSWATNVGKQVSLAKQNKQDIGGLLSVQSRIADRLVFSNLKKRLGGNVRFMISGGAPLQKHLMEFFHAAGLLILEGYGMTENASLSNHNRINNFKFGTVGPVIDNTEMLIADDGEILLRGPGVMSGYLNLESETSETIDSAGWLHTGDIGRVDEDGFLQITDRKKDIIVTSGGKNIAPAPIEAALSRIKLISQAVVYGNKRKFLTALVTLDPDAAAVWASENGISSQEDSLAAHPKLTKKIEAEIATMNQTLEQFETIKKFAIVPQEFSIDKGEVTPSLKLRKKVIEQRYADLIDGLYPKENN